MQAKIANKRKVMKAVQLTVEEGKLDILLTIINSLKNDIIKEVKIHDTVSEIEFVSDEENSYYENLIKNMTADDKIVVSEKSFVI